MAVTLSGMSEIKHVVLIHGMGGRGDYWAPARAAFLERALVAGEAVRDRGGDQRLERVELGVGQQVVDHDEAVRAERLDLFSRHHFAHRPAFSMNAINASL